MVFVDMSPEGYEFIVAHYSLDRNAFSRTLNVLHEVQVYSERFLEDMNRISASHMGVEQWAQHVAI